MKYTICGVYHYVKDNEEKTLIHYLEPLKVGLGYQSKQLFLNVNKDCEPNDNFEPIYELRNGKPVIADVKIVQ